ncbi:hypothetical protein [Maribacter hydrothermalis]|uniref:LTXXQ motif family protein n=1 Tax=Maribacter hydrothermalis TaxID=1836467 RepID=A0A1B7Z9L4_9FLAO|nr:hypothetical protein [Maribacter hydrothermalis]APQ16698.1 hypothetical protein BTR34_04905 [Maribacter hydrothermalis]OBR39385.1 hypothetical protein A9200_17420 [Maribacter hydrothermalis]
MKKLIMAILIMAGISATAQDHTRKGNRGDMGDLTPEQVATLQTKKMTLALDLNESQQAKIKTILTEDAKARKSKMDARKIKKEEGEKKWSADEKYAMQNERLDHQIARKKEMKSILNQEQFEKWEKMGKRMNKRHHLKKEGNKKEKRSNRD